MIITPETPTTDLDDLLKRYKTPRRRKKMTPVYQAMLELVQKEAQPKALLKAFDRPDLGHLEHYLKDDDVGAGLAIVTLGAELDAAIDNLGDDIVGQAVVVEVALAWITTIAQQVRTILKEKVAVKNLKVGPGYRPGVGNLPLTLQDHLFALLPADEIGVTLDEFKVMKPTKSTSLIIPVRPK